MTLKRINDEEFDAHVLDSKNPVLIKFTARWCKPCKALNPILESLMETHQHIDFYEIDIEDNPFLVGTTYVIEIKEKIFLVDGYIEGREETHQIVMDGDNIRLLASYGPEWDKQKTGDNVSGTYIIINRVSGKFEYTHTQTTFGGAKMNPRPPHFMTREFGNCEKAKTKF